MYAELPNLHRNYSYGPIIWGSVHPTEENIVLLKNIDMYNYTAVTNLNKVFGLSFLVVWLCVFKNMYIHWEHIAYIWY